MRVPIRKPGKFTHSKNDPHISEAKFLELKQKLAGLKRAQKELTKEVETQAATGDFSDNAPYQFAKARLRGINQGILETEEMIKRAIIIKPGDDGIIRLGNTVTVESNGRKLVYTILGSTETNPTKGIISYQSPIGAALLGRKIGDLVKMGPGQKFVEYKIVGIE